MKTPYLGVHQTGSRPVGVALNTRFVSASTYDVNARTAEQYSDNSIPARLYNDLSVTVRPTDRWSIGAGVTNLFNVAPPQFPSAVFGAGQFDTVGRYFFMNANVNF